MIKFIIRLIKKLGLWKEAIQVVFVKYSLEKKKARAEREPKRDTKAKRRNRRIWNEKQEKRNRLLK